MATVEASPKINIYQHLEQAMGKVARDWTEETELNGEPGGRDIHLSLARTVLLQAFSAIDNVPKSWRWGVSDEGIAKMGAPTAAPYTGIKVMALHSYHAALAAGYCGLSELEMKKGLQHPLSYEPLREITKLSNKIALPVERYHGLNSVRICDDGVFLVSEGRYTMKDGVVIMPRLEHEILMETRDILDEEIDEDSTTEEIENVLHGKGCAAEKAGVLANIHSCIVTICIKDTRLAVASLNRGLAAR